MTNLGFLIDKTTFVGIESLRQVKIWRESSMGKNYDRIGSYKLLSLPAAEGIAAANCIEAGQSLYVNAQRVQTP